MSQFNQPQTPIRRKSGPNVYTALALIAVLCLAFSAGALYLANTGMTGQANPLYLEGK